MEKQVPCGNCGALMRINQGQCDNCQKFRTDLVMTEADRRALQSEYSKGEVNREKAARYRSLLR